LQKTDQLSVQQSPNTSGVEQNNQPHPGSAQNETETINNTTDETITPAALLSTMCMVAVFTSRDPEEEGPDYDRLRRAAPRLQKCQS